MSCRFIFAPSDAPASPLPLRAAAERRLPSTRFQERKYHKCSVPRRHSTGLAEAGRKSSVTAPLVMTLALIVTRQTTKSAGLLGHCQPAQCLNDAAYSLRHIQEHRHLFLRHCKH